MRKPLTRKDLERAIKWAKARRDENRSIDVALGRFDYHQGFWNSAQSQEEDCGTCCCIHGASHIIAYGQETLFGPSPDDYLDCAIGVDGRPHCHKVMSKGDVTIEEIEASLDWTQEEADAFWDAYA